jgi:hypothetical protein
MMKLAISMTIAAGLVAMMMPGGVWQTMGLPASAALARPLDARPEAVLVGATLLLVASGLRRGFPHKHSK